MGKRSGKPKSLFEILVGTGQNGGYRYKSSGGATYTVGKAADRRAAGGTYVSVTRSDGGKKTNVYNTNGKKVRTHKQGW